MQQASDSPRLLAFSLLPLPRGAASVQRVPTAATVASVYPSCRASCRVSRQHSRATSNAVAHIRRLNDSFIHYFPAPSSLLYLPLSLSLSLSVFLSLPLALPAFLCVLSRIIRTCIYRACALDSGAFSQNEAREGQGQGVVQGKAGPKGKPVQGVDLSPPLGGLQAECDGALGLLLTSQRARVSPAVCPGT